MCGEATISADPSMDMFSLGVLAWEVMTGKRFFGGGWAGVRGEQGVAAVAGLAVGTPVQVPAAGTAGSCLLTLAAKTLNTPPADASDGEVRQMLMGHKLLPSEGDKSVLAQVRWAGLGWAAAAWLVHAGRAAQRMP